MKLFAWKKEGEWFSGYINLYKPPRRYATRRWGIGFYWPHWGKFSLMVYLVHQRYINEWELLIRYNRGYNEEKAKKKIQEIFGTKATFEGEELVEVSGKEGQERVPDTES